MTHCDDVLEQLPALAAGDHVVPVDISAHLEGCESCRATWQIVQAGARIGARAAAGIDSERMATTVLSRLALARQADRRRRGWAWGTLTAAAAALFLVVYPSGRSSQSIPPATTTAAVASTNFVVPVSGLDDLDAGELQTVYDQLEGALSGKASVAAPHLEELSPDEMEQVLNSLEG